MTVFKSIITATLLLFCVSAAFAQKKKGKKDQVPVMLTHGGITKEFLDSIQADLVWVTGGRFVMGDNSGEADEKPAHEVVVDGFAISRYPVTQRQWSIIMGGNPSDFKGCDRCPIDHVSWDEAQEFIRRLNHLTGKLYALPTEAEWEFAAKGGKMGRYYNFAGSDYADSVAWHAGNSGRMPHPVGEKLPNELGLYDMSGNMWEWCSDWYEKFYYELDEKYSPEGPKSGAGKVRRGGSWFTQTINCRITARNHVKQDYKDDAGTFRLAQYPN